MRDAILSVNEKEFILRVRLCCRRVPAASCLTRRCTPSQALHEDQRTDGRRPFESRSPKFQARPCRSVRDVGQVNKNPDGGDACRAAARRRQLRSAARAHACAGCRFRRAGACAFRCCAFRAALKSSVVARPQTPPFRDRPSEGVFNVSVEVGAMASSQTELGRPSEATIELTRLLERVLKQTGAHLQSARAQRVCGKLTRFGNGRRRRHRVAGRTSRPLGVVFACRHQRA